MNVIKRLVFMAIAHTRNIKITIFKILIFWWPEKSHRNNSHGKKFKITEFQHI